MMGSGCTVEVIKHLLSFIKIEEKVMKTIYIDVMRNGHFIKTLPYKHHEVMRLDEEKLRAFVLQKLPTLKDKDFDLFYD